MKTKQTPTNIRVVTDDQVAKKYMQLKQSAHSRGLDFNLSLKTVRRLLTRKTCHFTKVVLTEKKNSLSKRTVDRLDATKGYVEGNVAACSHAANSFKNTVEKHFEGELSRKQVLTVIKRMFER